MRPAFGYNLVLQWDRTREGAEIYLALAILSYGLRASMGPHP